MLDPESFGESVSLPGPRAKALMTLHKERERQEELREAGRFEFTAFSAPDHYRRLAIITEEVGELSGAIMAESGDAHDREGERADIRKEVIHVAASALAMLEHIIDIETNPARIDLQGMEVVR